MAGFLKSRFNTNEVIITIMLNYVAQYIVSYLVSGPLQAPGGIPQTMALETHYYLPKLMTGSRAHWGILMALVLAIAVRFHLSAAPRWATALKRWVPRRRPRFTVESTKARSAF